MSEANEIVNHEKIKKKKKMFWAGEHMIKPRGKRIKVIRDDNIEIIRGQTMYDTESMKRPWILFCTIRVAIGD